ncbi:MAG: L,D-transpeptidase family protein [Bacillota bacterium]
MARILINLAQRKLSYFQGDVPEKEYPVAIGKPGTPTPTGSYRVITKIINPGGILGTRWMGLSIQGGNYGIHGTPFPWTIGTMASLGCIRMYNEDIETLFPQVQVGTSVEIISGIATSAGYPPVVADSGPASPPDAGNKRYVVQPGDTLWGIARRHGIPLESIIQINGLINPDSIYPGQQILLP